MNGRYAAALTMVGAALLMAAPGGYALERTSVRADDAERESSWDTSASCEVSYANICTGWLWVWTVHVTNTVGLVLNPCCDNGQLVSTSVYFWTGASSGYAFTGTIAVSPVVAGSPGVPYDQVSILPPGRELVTHDWTVPAGPVVLTYTFAAWDGYGTAPIPTVPTDHPAAGPTGPQACGHCYPSTRTTHSFWYGTPQSPLFPGSPFSDGVCNAELLFWSGTFAHCAPVSVEPPVSRSWAAIKNMYR